MSPQVRVLVVDDHAIVREGVKSLIELQEHITVVGEAASSVECFNQVEALHPDVVFMDLKMPGIGGIEAARIIKEKHPGVKIIILTNYDDQEYVIAAIKIGVDAYVLKNVKKGDLTRIIHVVMKGQAYIDSEVAPTLFAHVQPSASTRQKSPSPKNLTQRELQILEHIVAGKSNREIAESIHLSLNTVKTHLKSIYFKLGVHNRSKVIGKVIQEGVVHLSI